MPGDTDTWNSECHGWSAGVIYLLHAYVTGITPTEPGYKKCALAPRFGKLTRVHSVIPVSDGKLDIEIKRTGKKFNIKLDIPADIELTYKGERLTSGEYTMPGNM